MEEVAREREALQRQADEARRKLEEIGLLIHSLREEQQEVLRGLRQLREQTVEEVTLYREALQVQSAEARDEFRQYVEEIGQRAQQVRGHLQAARQQPLEAGREMEAVLEQSRAAQEQLVGQMEQAAQRVRTDCAEAGAQARQLKEFSQQALRQLAEEFDGHLHQVRAELEDLKQTLRALPRPADQGQGTAEAIPSPEGRNRLGVTVEPGVLVAEVLADSPAALAGLARGDVITAVDGLAVLDGAELREAVRSVPGGTEVMLRLTRGEQIQDLAVRLAEPPGPEEAPPPEGHNRLGVTVEPGVVVAEVLTDGPAYEAGLSTGDVIVAVNGEPVRNGPRLRDALQGLPDRAEITLQVTRGGLDEEVPVRLDEQIRGETESR
jgi:C-terminal processing protease CtpA/Prc